MRHLAVFACLVAVGASTIYGCSSVYGAADDGAGLSDARDERAPNDATSSPVDAPTGDASSGDADGARDAATAACDLQAPFSTPEVVMGLGATADVYDPWLDEAERTIYFARAQAGSTPKIFVATRTAKTDVFGTPADLGVTAGANTYAERPTLTRDGLTLAFRSGSGGIAIVTRANVAAAFPAASLIAGLPSNPGSPNISGASFYFSAAYTIYGASRAGAAVSNVALVPGIQLPSTEDDAPVATPDELTLYFQSDRTSPAAGGRDIWVATRTSSSQPFGAAKHVPELSTSRADFVGWVSADGCVVYGATSPASGPYYIWRAQKPPR